MDKQKGLNEIRELAYGLYPNAKKITITIENDKITVAPNEVHSIPFKSDPDEDEE